MKNRWDWITVLRNEFFDSKEANNLCVIVVDWEKLAQGFTLFYKNFSQKYQSFFMILRGNNS